MEKEYEDELTDLQKEVALFCYGWLNALLHIHRKDTFAEFVERYADKANNIITNSDNGLTILNDDPIEDGVADIDMHYSLGRISGYIRLNKETGEWSLENCFDVYDETGELVAEDHAFKF